MKFKKPLIALTAISVGMLLINVNSYASNSYYLMSCTEQNIPTGYYDSIDTTVEEATFREALHDVISANYTFNSYDTAWTIDYYADADPYNEGHVLCLYTDQSVKNENHISSGGELFWNREHTWPKSHGFNDSSCEAYTDCHHLRAAESAINIAKSNNDFGELESGYTESYGNKYAGGVFEPKDDIKGDVARMLLYMMIRYGEYDDAEIDSTALNLTIVDDSDTTSTSTGNGQIAKLSTILSWHYQDPVSDREIYRNNVVYMFQKNRNPFIDHPEYVEYAFSGSGTYTDPGSTDPATPDTVDRTEEVLVDSTGFEDSDGFTAVENKYYYTQNAYETENLSYSGHNAVPSTTSAITDSQSMRLSVKANSFDTAQLFVTEDIYNLSRVTFKAKGGSSGLALNAMYSTDEGITWQTGEEFTLTTTGKSYEYVISSNGGYDKARFGFAFTAEETSSKYINIDDLCVYRYKTIASTEFERESTKSSLKFNYTATEKQVDGYNYQLVKSIDDISVGDEIIITALDYETYPYAMGAAQTNNYTKADITIKDEVLESEGDATVLTLGNGVNEGTYSLRNSEGKYLGNGTQGRSLKAVNALSETTSWTISIDESTCSAVLTVVSSSIENNRLQFYSTSKLFSCYSTTQLEIALFVKVEGSYNVTEYTYSNMNIRFGAVIEKDLYDALLALDSTAVFGMALSKDGTTYTNYECTPAIVAIVDGVSTADENGNYVQWAAVIPAEEANYSTLVYAKAYVIIDGETHCMNVACYSIKTLAAYYASNGASLGLSESDINLLGDLSE